MGRVPFDPRMVTEIRRSPRMRAEQGGGWLQGWGGPEQYQEFASLPTFERLTYAAVLEGHTEPSEIEVVTGLSNTQVSGALANLQRRKLVSIEAPEAK